IDLELVHVDRLAEHLLDGVDHARMRAEDSERLIVEMRGKGRARRTALLAPDLRPVGVIDADRLACEQVDLLLAEQLGQKQPALPMEEVHLLLRQFHGSSSLVLFCLFFSSWPGLPRPSTSLLHARRTSMPGTKPGMTVCVATPPPRPSPSISPRSSVPPSA